MKPRTSDQHTTFPPQHPFPAQVFTPLEYMKSWDQDFMAPAKAHEKFNHYNPEVPESEFRVIAPATIRQPGVYPGAVVQSDDTDEVPAAYTVYMPPVIKKAYIPGRDPEPGTEQDAPPSDTPMQPMAPSMASPMVPPILNPPMEHPKGAPPVTPRDSAAVLPAAMTMQQYPGMQGAMPRSEDGSAEGWGSFVTASSAKRGGGQRFQSCLIPQVGERRLLQ